MRRERSEDAIITKQIEALFPGSVKYDLLHIFDFDAGPEKESCHSKSLSEVLIRLAQGQEIPDDRFTLSVTTDRLKQMYSDVIVSALIRNRERLRLQDPRLKVDHYLEGSLNNMNILISEFVYGLTLMERVGKQAFIQGCRIFSEGSGYEKGDEEALASAMTAAAVLNTGRPLFITSRLVPYRGRKEFRRNCSVAPKDLAWQLRKASLLRIGGDDGEIELAFSYWLTELIGNWIYDSFLSQLRKGSVIVNNDMFKTRPEGLDVSVPSLVVLKRGETIKAIICD